MGGAWKGTVVLLAFACALALAACGSGDSSTSTGASVSTAAPAESKEAPSGSESSNGGEGSQSGSESSEPEGEESGSSEEGEVSPNDRSAQFRTKGGDNSIQNFGGEGSSAEREKATKVIAGVFAAQKAKEWAKVCGLLSAKATGQLEEFSKRSPQLKGKGCAQVIALILGSAPTSARPETIKGPVIALRTKGGESFALYRGTDGKAYAYPLVLENGQWKLIGMAPTPLNP
jgi:hypothetical protein